MLFIAKTVRQHVLFDYNGSQLYPGEITTQFRCEISIYIADFVILTPNMIKLKFSKIMRAVLSSEIDTSADPGRCIPALGQNPHTFLQSLFLTAFPVSFLDAIFFSNKLIYFYF